MTSTKRYFLMLTGFLFVAALLAHGAQEDDLIAVLRSGAGIPEKATACQQLRLHGTANAVPVLAEALTEERLGHAARYALEGMPYPEAGAALREALGRTTGALKAGVIDSLGQRTDRDALPLLSPLLTDADPMIASAAAAALGRIGGAEAQTALMAARNTVADAVRPIVLEALLSCAEQRMAQGDRSGAAKLYQFLYRSEGASAIGIAAWRGWMNTDATAQPAQALAALRSDTSALQKAAIRLLREAHSPALLDACLTEWDHLPATARIAALEAHLSLGERATPLIRLAAKSDDPTIRASAWQALTQVSDATLIPALAAAAAQGDAAEQAAAREGLARMKGAAAQAALIQSLDDTKDSAEKCEILQALGRRGDPSADQALLKQAIGPDAAARAAAYAALRDLAAPETLMPLLSLTANSPDATDRDGAQKALASVLTHHANPGDASARILSHYQQLTPTERLRVLPILPRLATAEALSAAQTAAGSDETELAREAARSLAQWPDAAPAPFLLETARTHKDSVTQTLALRGAIALTAQEPDADKRLNLLKTALTLASRPEEQRAALGQLSAIPTSDALALALARLDDPALTGEAGLTAIAIAERLAADQPEKMAAALEVLLEKCEHPDVVQRVWALRVQAPAAGPFIRDWLIGGPYRQDGVVGAVAAYHLEVGPEKDGEAVEWRRAPSGDTVNLAGLFPGQDNCVAYLKTTIHAPKATDALLLMGSDDGIKAWVNGEVVHGNPIDRGQIADQDMAPIRLRQGANDILLKIAQGGGGWSACARIVDSKGKPIEGLTVSLPGDAAPAPAPAAQAPAAPPAPPEIKETKLPPREAFRTLRLSDQFYAEGAYYGDFNRDGKMDIVAGPFWFEGPDFTERHEYRPPKVYDPKNYSDNFLTYAGDFNGDGWTDILCVPFPGVEGFWFANPAGKDGHWVAHRFHDFVGDESPMWADVTGDGRPELLFTIQGYMGYAGPDPANPDKPWTFHAVSTKDDRYQKFTHGIGSGDINGDGRSDMIEAVGWWEQPAQPKPGEPWIFHPFHFADAAAQMLVYDVDGDGLSDVITSWHCHLYGMVWWKQVRDGAGKIDWRRHVILTPEPDTSTDDFRISQLHALDLADMNGDGLMDIVTGKRFWSHGPTGDVEPSAAPVVFWLELHRDGQGGVSFTPRLIDDNSGVGTQVTAADLNGDGKMDVVVGNKKGIFVHLNELK